MDGRGDFVATKCTCINCEQKFSITKLSPLKGRIPLALPCNHSICDACVRDFIKKTLAIECNICHALHNISADSNFAKPNDDSWVRSFLPINLYVLGTLLHNLSQYPSQQGPFASFDPKFKTKSAKQTDKNSLLLQLSSTELCTHCNGGAEIKCQQCDAFLCSHCFSITHGSYAPLQKHQKVPIGSVKLIETLTVCPLHKDKNLEFFCNDCEKYICFSCMFTGTSCSTHKVQSLTEKNTAMLDQLQQEKESANGIYRRLNKTLVDISNLLNSPTPKRVLPQKENSVISKIVCHFARLHAALQIREKELIKLVEDASFAEKKDLQNAKVDIFNNLGNIDEVLNVCEFALREENISKVNLTQLAAKLKEINNYPWHLLKEPSSVEENDTDSVAIDEEVFNHVSQHVTVTNGKHYTYKLISTDDIPDAQEIPPVPETVVESEYTIAKEMRQLKLTKTVSDLSVANISMSNSSANSVTSEISSKAASQNSQPLQKQPKGKRGKASQPFSEISMNTTKNAAIHHFSSNPQNFTNDNQNFSYQHFPDNPQNFTHNHQNFPHNYQNFANQQILSHNYPKFPPNQQNPYDHPPPNYLHKNQYRYNSNSVIQKYNSKQPQKNFHINNSTSKPPSEPKQLSVGLVEVVKVAYINNPHDFYVHRSHFNQKLSEMALSFQTAASWGAPTLEKIYEELVLVFHQNGWFRAKVLKAEEEKYFAYCVDQGNTISVTMDKIRLMPPQYATEPWIAIKCSLSKVRSLDGKWTYENSVFMTKVINNKPVVMQVVGIKQNIHSKDGAAGVPEPYLMCNLALQEDQKEFAVDIADAMIYAGEAALHNKPTNINKTFFHQMIYAGIQSRPNFYPANILTTKQLSSVVLTHVENPGKFFIRKVQNDVEYIKLMLDINKHYDIDDNTGVVYVPEVGMNVACNVTMNPTIFVDCTKFDIKDAQGGTWLRGKITHLASDQMVGVFLVDTGHLVTVNSLAVRRLVNTFMRMNILALECEMFEVKPVGSWSPESTKFLSEFTKRELKVWTANKAQKQRTARVILYDPDDDSKPSINKQLVEKGYAIATGITIDGKVETSPAQVYKRANRPVHQEGKKIKVLNEDGNIRLEVKIISTESPSEIFVSLASQQESLKQLSADLDEFYESTDSIKTDWQENDRCAVLLPSKGWCRANVNKTFPDAKAELFLMDHAITLTAPFEDMRKLNEKFSTVRDGAIKCHLNGIMKATDGDWPKLTCECLKELMENYDEIFISKGGELKNNSLPVDMWVIETTSGGALDPVKKQWLKLNTKLIDQGLALPTERNKLSIFETLEEGSKIMDEWLMIIDDAVGDSTIDGNNKLESVTSKIFSEWLPPPLPLKKKEFTGIASYVDYDLYVFLHDVDQAETLDLISSELNRLFRDSEPSQKDMYWTVGQPCIAEFSLDSRFYRGKITEILDDKLIITFVDYGNVEECDLSKVRKAAVLCDIPVQCYQCELVGIRPKSDQYTRFIIDFLHKTIVDKEIVVKVVDASDKVPVSVKLCLGDMDISDMMIRLGFVLDSTNTMKAYSILEENTLPNKNEIISDSESDCMEDTMVMGERPLELELSDDPETENWALLTELDQKRKLAKQCKYMRNNFPGGYTFSCNVEGIIDSTSFCLRICSSEFDELMIDLQINALKQPRMHNIFELKPCIALYEGDHKWYRAEILNYDNIQKVLKVMFVDFGNIELVSLKDVRESSPDWCRMPPNAISGHLHDICVSKHYSDLDVIEMLKKLVLSCDLNGRIISSYENTAEDSLFECYYVELFNSETDEPAYQILVDQKLYICRTDEKICNSDVI